jgi:hypothetical protein
MSRYGFSGHELWLLRNLLAFAVFLVCEPD